MKRLFSILALSLALASCGPAPEPSHNGIWLWSKYMTEADLDDFVARDIHHVILHEISFTRHGVDSTLAFIREAQSKDIRVHVWFQCFYQDGQWINPVDDSLNRYICLKIRV